MNAALTATDGFLKLVTTARARIGATESGLESSIDALNSSILNLSDARSRIIDVDYEAESIALVKAQIMLQASSAMLVQANGMTRKLVELLLAK